MSDIANNLNIIRQQIASFAQELDQIPQLVAVSKTFPPQKIQEAYAQNQRVFSENYVAELEHKAKTLANLDDIEWHFIGTIQSNKTKTLALHAAWIHSLTCLKHAIRLNQHRPSQLPPLQVLIEVNISNESNKGGLTSLEEIINLANEIKKLPNLNLRGLMGMASHTQDEKIIESQFELLSSYLAELNKLGFNLDQLSMGMSNDYHIAIRCGATMVRLGSKIFGKRAYVK